ncbi:MAG: NAD(P)-dependent alcohol dehydrogenase [Myxococcales bacterium]
MIEAKAYAAYDAQTNLKPFSFARRDPGESDVLIDILFCGVCHSDLHQVRNEWAGTKYPLVPGHEIVGRVAAVGGKVTRFRAGDTVGVGCFVDSCRSCDACRRGLENYCAAPVMTYNSPEKDGKSITYGGYSSRVVVDQDFVLKVAAKGRLDAIAPLLCAGITTYSPLRHWKIGKGHRLGVLGLGGLGHMAVKLGNAFGAEVTLLSSSPAKKADAKRLGAHEFLLHSDRAAMKTAKERFDFIIDTVSAPHDLAALAGLLKLDGTLILLGAPPKPAELPAFALIPRRRSVAGSLVGGIAQTQEMLDFCGEHQIVSDVEVIPAQKINEAYDRMVKGDVRYRFSIDMSSLR